MNKIITIGREFGSGGRELGKRLSEELQIAYYDQEIYPSLSIREEVSIHLEILFCNRIALFTTSSEK